MPRFNHAEKMVNALSRPKTQKWTLVLGSYLLAMLFGLAWASDRRTALPQLVSLIYCNTVTMIVWLDARRRGRGLPLAWLLVIFFTWPVALPIYYWVTRGWKGFLKGGLFTGSLLLISSLAAGGMIDLLETKAWQAHAQGDYDKAVQFYTRVLDVDPQNEWAKKNRALALRSSKGAGGVQGLEHQRYEAPK